MTPQEAVKILKGAIKKPNTKDGYLGQAIDLAIKALEQQPCEDCISRVETLKAIEEQKKGFYGVERYAIDECHSAVMKLPSVTPKQKIGRWK